MKVISIDFEEIPKLPKTAAAIGYFDGFHRGHQQLIAKTIRLAKEKKVKSAILTFYPDPWTVFKPYDNHDNLVSLSDKTEMAAAMGVDYLYVVHFTKEFAGRTVEEFHKFLKNMHVRYLVCGFDFTYGYKGLGNVNSLKSYDKIETFPVDAIEDLDMKISSTRIERLIRAGLLLKANELQGYIYSLPGVVVKGYRRGSSLLEFPTANLQVEKGYVLPARGVYAGYVLFGSRFYPAMINIGSNPTFGNDQVSIEAHIFNFHKEIYGSMVRFFFAQRIRPEIRFHSVEALKKQLEMDQKRAWELLVPMKGLLERTKDLWSLDRRFDILEQ